MASAVVYKSVNSYRMSFAEVVSPPVVRMGGCGGNQPNGPVVKLSILRLTLQKKEKSPF